MICAWCAVGAPGACASCSTSEREGSRVIGSAPLVTERIDENRVRIRKQGGMRVPGLVFADKRLFGAIGQDQALQQVRNVACLPGIVRASLAMPDIHWGYAFPIGGGAAVRLQPRRVSPRAVRCNRNSAVRLSSTG